MVENNDYFSSFNLRGRKAMRCTIRMTYFFACMTIAATSMVFGSNYQPAYYPEISTEKNTIQVGEPLVLTLTYRYVKPQLVPDSNELKLTVSGGGSLQVMDGTGRVIIERHGLYEPGVLRRVDTVGLIYRANFVVFYNHKQGLIFKEPGTYRVKLSGYDGLGAKAPALLTVTVKPTSPELARALSVLSEPSDYYFLEFGQYDDPADSMLRISHLEQVFERAGDTALGRWCSARLGLEYFKDFHKKHPSFEKFKTELQQSKVEEPLFNQAHAYLTKGASLIDEFPIREEVLYQLARTEGIKGNYKKALSLLDELGKKYCNGEYGKRSDSAKEELQKLIEREKGSTPPALWTRPSFLIVIAAGIGIVVIILIFLLKKKAHSGGK